MDQVKIGKFISIIRKEKKMTQEELAEKLGVSSKSVSRWETGKCMPDISLLESLSIELDITINELIKGSKILNNDIKEVTDDNLKNSLIEIKKSKKIIKKLSLISIILVIFIILFQIASAKKISFESFKIINYSEKFYNILKSNDYKKIEDIVTKEYIEDQWHTSITNYTTSDFIIGLKDLNQNNIKYDSFNINKFGYNERYYVEYKMCFRKEKEKSCVGIQILEATNEEDKYLFLVFPIGDESDLQKNIIDVFNPVWYIK